MRTSLALAFHEEIFWLWLLEQFVMLAVPAVLLLSGRGAAVARGCLTLSRHRPWLATVLFAAFCGALFALGGLVVDLLRAVRLAPYTGRQPPGIPGWLVGQIVPTLSVVLVLAAAGFGLNAIIRRSGRWWWLWVSAGLTLVASLYLLVLPLADAQLRAYPRIESSAQATWSPRIEAILDRAGAHGAPVLVRPTRAGDRCRVQNSAIGLGPTRAIVLADQIFSEWEPAMVDVAVAHELKHYLFDNTWLPVLLIAALSVAGAFAIQRAGNSVARRFATRLGFSSLAEPAALPLLMALLQLYLLVAIPAFNLTAQKRELDADRFALELTHDNEARAKVSATKCGDLWLPDDPLFERLYINTHPSVARRVRFANEYRPWETGEPGAYAEVLKNPRP